MPIYSGRDFGGNGRSFEKCEFCGRFGAQKIVETNNWRGFANGFRTMTFYLCRRCEDKRRIEAAAQSVKEAT